KLSGQGNATIPIMKQPGDTPKGRAGETTNPFLQPVTPTRKPASFPPASRTPFRANSLSADSILEEVPETEPSKKKEYYLGFRLGPRISTSGVGFEIAKGFTPRIGARIGLNYLDYEYTDVVSDIDYNLDLRLQSLALLADWHPFKGMFRISTGAIINGNRLNMLAELDRSSPEEINGVDYSLDSVRGSLKFNTLAPYLGLGWDTTFGDDDSWGLTFDLGVIYCGSPKLQLSAIGPDTSLANFSSDLEQERLDLENDLADFRFWPVVSAGFLYQF
ncbi:MAG: hypothetical protein VCA36_09465, partial [Opitutales bacterium]